MKVVTISSVFVKALLEGAVLKGYNAEEILRDQGISPQILTNEKLRVSTSVFAELYHAVALLLRDETYGLLAKPQIFGSFDVLARACLSAETVEESLRIWRNGFNRLDNNVRATTSFNDDGGYLTISCDYQAGTTSHFIIDTLLLTSHRMQCWLANEFIPIERVDLSYPAPKYVDEYRFIFYGAPVRFKQKNNAIHFSRQSLELSCYRDIKAFKNFLKNPYKYLLAQPKQGRSVYVRTRLWMENRFRKGGGNPQLDQAADYMGLTEQTLRRRLNKDGYSFQKLKDDTRRDMAIHLISSKQKSVEDIAFQLGFSEASSFIRAFKKWTRLTPLAYRKMS